jgi:hypothetical protein
VYHEQIMTGQQGNEIKTDINKNVDLRSVLLQAPESFGNKTSGIDGLNTEIHCVQQKLLFHFEASFFMLCRGRVKVT